MNLVIILKKGLLICIIVLLLIGIFILLKVTKSNYKTYEYKIGNTKKILEYKVVNEETNYVKIDTDKGLIFVKLYPDVAPITVNNFKKLVNSNFYTNMIFHRVINNFMIQTGGFTMSGYKNTNETIKGEFLNNGVTNNLSHTRGVVSMARTDASMDSASSQFFIVQKNSTYLDGNYAAFGKVIAGMDVVDSIAIVKTDENDKPISNVKLNSITFVSIRGEI